MTAPEPPAAPPVVPPAQGEPKPAPTPATTPDPPKAETDWKAEARKWEARAKENLSAAEKLAALEEKDKTDLQRAQARAEAAEKKAAELEAAEKKRAADAEAARQIADWKAKVSKETDVPADVLRGSTLEDIQAHAESLKALLPEPRKPGYVPGEGRTVAAGKGDPRQIFAEILKSS
jgi:hypothetical protein